MTSAPEAQAGKGGVEKAANKGAAYRITKAVWGKDVAEKKKGATGVALLSHVAGGAALKAGQLAARAVVKALPRVLSKSYGAAKGKVSPGWVVQSELHRAIRPNVRKPKKKP